MYLIATSSLLFSNLTLEKKCEDKMLVRNETETISDLCNSTVSNTQQEYDSHGAMLFVVATILVYAGAVVAFIAGHIKKRRFHHEEEVQIYKYLNKSQLKIRQKIRSHDVLQTRVQLLRAFQENTGCGNRRERNNHSENVEDQQCHVICVPNEFYAETCLK